VDTFAAVLRGQIATGRRDLERARGARDWAGVRSCGLRLRYLLDMAAEQRIAEDGPTMPDAACRAERDER